ncbi:hypothetical protein KA005_43820 [bacterium]|nr:hypothetical protein [bacterium]
MKVFLVSYDLKKPGRNYTELYEALKKAHTWWHYLDSCWLLKTSLSARQLFDSLKPHIDGNDFLLIIEVTKNYTGWLPQKAWDWMDQNI